MSQSFGIESQHRSNGAPHRQPARFLIVIEAGGSMVAKLYLDNREEVAEFDAGSEEVAQMTKGLKPTQDAGDPAWDKALAAHNSAERAGADVYVLDL